MNARTEAEISARPLDSDAFAPFGHVVQHAGQDRRTHFPGLIEAGATAWVSRVSEPLSLPAKIRLLERHPHSSQLFAPLRGQRALIVVCHSDGAGAPDIATAKAFLAEPWQGVSYGRNVWHHGLNVLAAPADFLVAMATGRADDDVFFELETPLTVSLPTTFGETHGAA